MIVLAIGEGCRIRASTCCGDCEHPVFGDVSNFCCSRGLDSRLWGSTLGDSDAFINNAGASQKIMMRSAIMHAACRADGNTQLIPMVAGDSPTRKMAGEGVVGVRTPSANPRAMSGGGVETLFLVKPFKGLDSGRCAGQCWPGLLGFAGNCCLLHVHRAQPTSNARSVTKHVVEASCAHR